MARAAQRLPLRPLALLLIQCFVFAPCCVLLAYSFYLVVEKRFINSPKR